MRAPGRWSILGALVVLAIGASAAIALMDRGGGGPRERAVHQHGEGPLSATAFSGLNSLLAPQGTPWSGTFGGLLLCTTNGEPIRLTAIRPTLKAPPTHLQFVIRRTPAGGSEEARMPVIAQKGTTQDPSYPIAGVLTPLADPADVEETIDQPCGSPPTDAYTEILTVMTTDDAGAWIDGIELDYTQAGRQHTLQVEWQYVLCGHRAPASACSST